MVILTPLSLIDTLFNTIMRVSLRGIRACFEEKTKQVPPAIHTVSTEEVEEENGPHTFKTIQDILEKENSIDSVISPSTTYYVSGVNVPVYENPTIEFDSQIGMMSYGEAILVHEARGRFFRITQDGLSGWVLRDDCVDRASLVYPEFRVGQEHSVDHPYTAHVRAIIKDEFGVGHSEFALQAGEYVLYKLWRKGIHVVWPTTRPRVPGVWHTILKGVQGVHIGVTPKTGSVMEYMINSDVGHVAYVEAVFPDDTISISEANFPDSGIYSERTLNKEEWKILKPLFIQLT